MSDVNAFQNLYKTDTSLRRALWSVPRGVRLKRFYFMYFLKFQSVFMRRSNCSAPIPRAPPGTSLFLCCPGLLITSFFPCPAPYSHKNHPFFECPALFYHTHFSSDPGAARGGMGAEQFDRRIRVVINYTTFMLKVDPIGGS